MAFQRYLQLLSSHLALQHPTEVQTGHLSAPCGFEVLLPEIFLSELSAHRKEQFVHHRKDPLPCELLQVAFRWTRDLPEVLALSHGSHAQLHAVCLRLG